MNQILLAAGLLGVGMAEALKRLVSREARQRALPYVIASVTFGAVACYFINFALLRGGQPSLPEILGSLIVLVAVIVRFRQ